VQNFVPIEVKVFVPQYAKMRAECILDYFLGSDNSLPAMGGTDFDAQYVVSRMNVPFGGPENKWLHFDPISHKNLRFWRHFGWYLENFRLKMGFNIVSSKRQRPLFVKLRLWKLDVE